VSVADHATPYRDAEAWLAERGVIREPIDVASRQAEDVSPGVGSDRADPDRPVGEVTARESVGEIAARESAGEVGARAAIGEVGAREARRLLGQAGVDAALTVAERDAAAPAAPGLEHDVAQALAFIRRSTAGAPQAEGRLRDKLIERGHPEQVVTLALERARRERLVDDRAMAAALVDEKRRAGHAPARIRRDLRGRGFGDEILDPLLAMAESEDQEAAAFALAVERAAGLTGVAAETAYRRVVGHVTRRGYPEALARKVARGAVFSSREQERAAGR
jgi:regulatory protein